MTINHRLIAAAGLAIALSLGHSDARAQAAAAANAPVRLGIRLEAGKTYRFRVQDDTVSRANLPGGIVRRKATRVDATFDLIAERVNTDGSVAVRVKPVRQTVLVNDRPVPVPEADKADATATLSREARLSGLPEKPESDEEEESDVMTASDFLGTLFDEDAGFPGRALNVGEGWKDQVESPLDEDARLTVNSALVGLETLDNRPAARILNVVAEPVRTAPDEDGVSMEGTLEGGGLANLDLATGLPMDSRDTVRLKVNVSAPGPDGTPVTFDSETSVRMRIQALAPGG